MGHGRWALIPSAEAEEKQPGALSQSCSAPGGRVLHAPSQATHRGVRYTAGEGHPALLTAVAGATAVEVDIEVPVLRAIRPTAQVLQSEKRRTIRFPARAAAARHGVSGLGTRREVHLHVCISHREMEAAPPTSPRAQHCQVALYNGNCGQHTGLAPRHSGLGTGSARASSAWSLAFLPAPSPERVSHCP